MQPTPAGWRYQLDAAKFVFGNPPDDTLLLAGLSDERRQAQISTVPYADYDWLRDARRRFDPADLLTPGYEVFGRHPR